MAVIYSVQRFIFKLAKLAANYNISKNSEGLIGKISSLIFAFQAETMRVACEKAMETIDCCAQKTRFQSNKECFVESMCYW